MCGVRAFGQALFLFYKKMRCKRLERVLMRRRFNFRPLKLQLQVIDCFLLKYLSRDIYLNAKKRRAIIDYLTAHLRDDFLDQDPSLKKRLTPLIRQSQQREKALAEQREPQAQRCQELQDKAAQEVARFIPELTDNQREQVRHIILGQHEDTYRLEQKLMGATRLFNWDWRDIVRTERAILSNERYLAKQTADGEQRVQWRAHPSSCRYCLRWHGFTFRVVDPGTFPKNTETDVWVGKIAECGGPYRRLTKRRKPFLPYHRDCQCLWLPVVEIF